MKLLILPLCLFPTLTGALTLDIPGRPEVTGERQEASASLALPSAAWNGSTVPLDSVPGALSHMAYRSATKAKTTEVAFDLIAQLDTQGFKTELSCNTIACGGFDFRHNIDLLDPPEMFVNLADFHAISARHENGTDAAFVFISRSQELLFMQVSHVSTTGEAPSVNTARNFVAATPTEDETKKTPNPMDLAQSLETVGYFVLSDLAFQTGSSNLGEGTFASMTQLGEYLVLNPDVTVALVGHTDAEGSLEGNIALSKRRAGSVREKLLTEFAIDPNRVEAEGMGYLSPVANNRTEDGRDRNRRVEVIVTSTN